MSGRIAVRLSLIDLLIWVALVAFGFAVVRLAIPSGHLPEHVALLLQCGVAVVAYLVGASFIYRRMLLWPLLSPVCPHCGKRPGAIEITGTWPVFIMSCGSCQGRTELRMAEVDISGGDSRLPCLQLNWPYFLGWYTRVR
jgi:hypothetical protein